VISNQPPVVENVGQPPMVGCELPDGIRLVYTDDRGRRHAITLVEARAVDFGQTRSFRAPPAYRGQRNFPGWWWSVTTRSHVVYESWLGRHHIIEADRDARVTGISGQPFALTWASGKRQVWHTPDLYCRMFDGKGVVTDCRSTNRVNVDFGYKCAVIAAACQEVGWEFRLVGEPDPVWAANLRWLAGYRHPRFANAELEEHLVKSLAQPKPLGEAAGQAGDPIRVLPVLFHLMWLGRLAADLSTPLGNGTILSASVDPLETT
jgi:hypothetical protein